MIKRNFVTLASVDRDGGPMFPGVWIETWLRVPGTDVWLLVDLSPAQIAET